jgi:hypothetical protein
MSEPWHRRWLHALEADRTVPGTAMQMGRIYADYAASKGGRWADPAYPELIRQTHRTRDAISTGIGFLVDHGWLRLRGEWVPGQAKTYDLIIPGQRRNRPVPPTSRLSRTPEQKRPAEPTGSVRPSRPEASGPADQPAQPTTTVRPSRPEASGPAGRIRLTSSTSLPPLSPRGLHARLAQAVPDVTERESDQVRQLIGRRPGIRSAAAVMRAEIEQGNGPALVRQIRTEQQRAAGVAARRHHDFDLAPNGFCAICNLPKTAVTHRTVRVPD